MKENKSGACAELIGGAPETQRWRDTRIVAEIFRQDKIEQDRRQAAREFSTEDVCAVCKNFVVRTLMCYINICNAAAAALCPESEEPRSDIWSGDGSNFKWAPHLEIGAFRTNKGFRALQGTAPDRKIRQPELTAGEAMQLDKAIPICTLCHGMYFLNLDPRDADNHEPLPSSPNIHHKRGEAAVSSYDTDGHGRTVLRYKANVTYEWKKQSENTMNSF